MGSSQKEFRSLGGETLIFGRNGGVMRPVGHTLSNVLVFTRFSWLGCDNL